MAQSTENTTYTAFPNQLFDDLVQGKIDNTMFNLLIWLYRRALWKKRDRHASFVPTDDCRVMGRLDIRKESTLRTHHSREATSFGTDGLHRLASHSRTPGDILNFHQ